MPPDEAAKRQLRRPAHGWLQAELNDWRKVLETAEPARRAFVIQTLKNWQQDPDLAGVRDPDPLARLPEAERIAWPSLWTEAAGLIDQVAKARP